MQTENIGLVLAYWLHMLATIAWIGGLAALSLFVIPAARRTLEPETYARFLGRLQIQLQRIGWFSLAILIGTGLFEMAGHPAYQGFLKIDSSWAVAIFIKHIVIGGMVAASAYITWGLTPGLQRLAMLQAAGAETDQARLQSLRRKEIMLFRINLGLSALVLLLTAFARAA
jgi:uncharacterized membrane protein